MESEVKKRADVKILDTWNLERIYKTDEKWWNDFDDWKKFAEKGGSYKGLLSDPDVLFDFFRFEEDLMREGEKLETYAFLKSAEDLSNTTYQEMKSSCSLASSVIAENLSFVTPELFALSDETWYAFLSNEKLSPWKLKLERLLRFKNHTLSEQEERLLASVGEVTNIPSKTFRLLSDAETKFNSVTDDTGEQKPLTHETFQLFLP
ncbi:MAG: hypothetical protein HUJ63_01660 [Enterococcus sp.]|nr:hypothetical protein [Enterococcus sp.]